jgi:starch phosphorylase
MPHSKDKRATSADIQLLKVPELAATPDAILEDFTRYFSGMLGRRTINTDSPFLYQSVVLAVRDRLVQRWNQTGLATARDDNRRVAYLSLEFLMGRLLSNAMLNLDLEDSTEKALARLGLDIETVLDHEHDAGLGNGGLGRLAACFLDSCATLALPVIGYGIRYRYGMFRQRITDGNQFEEPDSWLREGFPWEIEKFELAQVVKFHGWTETYVDAAGETRHVWQGTHDVLAIPYDVPVPGYRNGVVNTLRLWSAEATDDFDLEEFNAGSYSEAVAMQNAAEKITMVLYPNDATESGKELRLQQQYFMASASLQDTLRRWQEKHGDDFRSFADKNCYQLNDTHPAIAVPELMRLLMDVHGLSWNTSWEIVSETMAYTNHTLLPEALEEWPLGMMQRLLPRIVEIIHEINARFMAQIAQRWPGDADRLTRMSLIRDGAHVRMAYVAIVGSYSVNGVAELHSNLLREGLFRDFADLWPEKFNNKTNGVTQRRWLAACNKPLADLISATIGDGWVTDLTQVNSLREKVGDREFEQRWREIKRGNKVRLAREIEARTGIEVDTGMLFDVQVKRIHEYKRQLLNLLHATHLYDRIRRGDGDDLVPRAIIIGGKAAPGYVMAKCIIKCINDVAEVINRDPLTKGKLRVIFFPDYNVSAMELICPAADLSEQISTAGKEASGTGNMKFMMNGALTIGTLDGANVEILQSVGHEHFFLFGNTVEELNALRPHYDPEQIILADEDLSRVLGLLSSGHFEGGTALLQDVIRPLRDRHDPWMTVADFRSFVDAQQRVETAWQDKNTWTASSIINTASSGMFSADRTIAEYNNDIWHLDPIKLTKSVKQ